LPAAAVIDTSFWSLCCQCHLEPYLWTAWASPIWVPPVVKAQIFDHPGDYPDQRAFLAAEQQHRVQLRHPRELIDPFRHGEREVLSLAQELGATALVDDFSAHRYARGVLGLDAMGVLEFALYLLAAGVIGMAEAEAAYRRLAYLRATHQGWLQWAYEQLTRQGGKP
jgi:hypothetical protein